MTHRGGFRHDFQGLQRKTQRSEVFFHDQKHKIESIFKPYPHIKKVQKHIFT